MNVSSCQPHSERDSVVSRETLEDAPDGAAVEEVIDTLLPSANPETGEVSKKKVVKRISLLLSCFVLLLVPFLLAMGLLRADDTELPNLLKSHLTALVYTLNSSLAYNASSDVSGR